MASLGGLKAYTDSLPRQNKKMRVLFTSHGNPLDIPMTREERPFWNTLFELAKKLQKDYEVKAALVVSAHWCWCTKGTFVNISVFQMSISYPAKPDYHYQLGQQLKSLGVM